MTFTPVPPVTEIRLVLATDKVFLRRLHLNHCMRESHGSFLQKNDFLFIILQSAHQLTRGGSVLRDRRCLCWSPGVVPIDPWSSSSTEARPSAFLSSSLQCTHVQRVSSKLQNCNENQKFRMRLMRRTQHHAFLAGNSFSKLPALGKQSHRRFRQWRRSA